MQLRLSYIFFYFILVVIMFILQCTHAYENWTKSPSLGYHMMQEATPLKKKLDEFGSFLAKVKLTH